MRSRKSYNFYHNRTALTEPGPIVYVGGPQFTHIFSQHYYYLATKRTRGVVAEAKNKSGEKRPAANGLRIEKTKTRKQSKKKNVDKRVKSKMRERRVHFRGREKER